MRLTGWSDRPARLFRCGLLALALAGCSAPGTGPAPPAGNAPRATTSAPSFVERMRSMLFRPVTQTGRQSIPQQSTPDSDEPVDCPPLDVRQGASTLVVHGPGEPIATNVRYQASVAQLARECAVFGEIMTVKIGLQGRIILGPAGGPGQITVPIRFALVREGPQPRTIWTELYWAPVEIGPGQVNVPFVHIDDNITVPKPSAAELEAYVFYVGFDRLAMQEQQQQQQKKPAGRRPRGGR